MKTLIRLMLLAFLAQLPSIARAQVTPNQIAVKTGIRQSFPNEAGGHTGALPFQSHQFNPLPPSVQLPPGTDSIPIQGTWPQQSNSRALHNMQIDPSNPNNIHVVITGLLDNSGKDVGSQTRRCFYTFSSNGGKTWTAPVTLGKYRTGYADMQLYQRNGVWVPIIAAHTFTDEAGDQTVTTLWVEKGNPGDGNFAECMGTDISMSGNSELIIWPCVAVSNDGTKAYTIASVSPPTVGGSEDQLQFGVWNLTADTAIFQGWSAEPGSSDPNNPTAGITSGGAYRIEVSQSGNIGVMWENSQSDDGSLYFSESTDGGVTWPPPTYILEGINLTDRTISTPSGDTIYSWNPTPYLDFWYDGDQSHFMYVGYYYSPVTATTGIYLPYTTTTYFVPDAVEGDSIAVANAGLNATPGSGSIPNMLDFTGGSTVNLQGLLPICWPTVARTTDSNHFSIFYQTFIEGDTITLSGDTIFALGSIFYSSTLDGGKTWTDPTPFMVNTPGASQKYDFRFPQTSTFNPSSESGITYHCVFSVDSAAGFVDTVGQPGFNVISYAHASVTVPLSGAGVSEGNAPLSMVLNPNYPDPFNSATTIQFTIPNASNVLLTVTDMLGRPIATLQNGFMGAGEHSVTFNGLGLPDGVYRYTLSADGESVSKSMTLLR